MSKTTRVIFASVLMLLMCAPGILLPLGVLPHWVAMYVVIPISFATCALVLGYAIRGYDEIQRSRRARAAKQSNGDAP